MISWRTSIWLSPNTLPTNSSLSRLKYEPNVLLASSSWYPITSPAGSIMIFAWAKPIGRFLKSFLYLSLCVFSCACSEPVFNMKNTIATWSTTTIMPTTIIWPENSTPIAPKTATMRAVISANFLGSIFLNFSISTPHYTIIYVTLPPISHLIWLYFFLFFFSMIYICIT